MSFVRLYKFAADLREYPIKLEGVLDEQAKRLTSQDELWYVPADLDEEISLGHVKQYRYSRGVYDADPVWVTEIRYSRTLDMQWRRYVCCKELMHVFDSADERTESADRLEQLLDEIETPLPAGAASPMYLTESRAKWMALLVLCPKPLRDHFRQRWLADELSDYEVALELQLPEILVHSLMSDRYDRVFDLLIGPAAAQMDLNGNV